MDNILIAKENLKKNGFCSFNLNDFDSNAFHIVKKYLMCNSDNNLKETFKQLRLDYKNIDTGEVANIPRDFESHEEAVLLKNKMLDKLKVENAFTSQIWFYSDVSSFNVKRLNNIDIDLEKFLKETFSKITRYFFDFEESQKFGNHVQFTYYDTNCHLENHSDGTGTGRICAILLYLNESYNIENGGYLVLENTEKVVPEIGNVAIIDLQSFDIKHMVTKVTGGIGRYACLSFVKKEEDIFK